MEQTARQMTDLRDTDPDGWTDYGAEGRAWEEDTVDRLETDFLVEVGPAILRPELDAMMDRRDRGPRWGVDGGEGA